MMDDRFAPPSAVDTPETDLELASLGQRLVGALVDVIGLYATFVGPPLLVMTAFGGPEHIEETPAEPLIGLLALVGLVFFQLGQWILITNRSQSLGKLVTGTRIVTLDGEPCGFVQGVLLRNWVLGAATGVLNILCLGWTLSLLDKLLIFGPERRCLHDQIAGTRVVSATAPRR